MVNHQLLHECNMYDKMARWKLTRITYGNNEEFTLLDGEEVTMGRGVNNNISLSSIVISRNHCVLNVQADQVLITDLKSSNGVYVGLKKIQPNTPHSLQESDVIGIGWTQGAPVANIKDTEKYMFRLTKDKSVSITSRLTFQNDDELIDLESELAAINIPKSKDLQSKKSPDKINNNSDVQTLNRNSAVKRRLEKSSQIRKVKKEISNGQHQNQKEDDVITISDSDNELPQIEENTRKKPKLELISEECAPLIKQEDIKIEKEEEFDPFKVKQEYLGYDDEPIQIDSDSDGESVQWLMRLSQSSPGKTFTKVKESKQINEETSYSQIDDFDDEFVDDLISIPPQPPEIQENEQSSSKVSPENKMDIEDEEFLDDLISLAEAPQIPNKTNIEVDVVDGCSKNIASEIETNAASIIEPQKDNTNKTQLIVPIEAPHSKPSSSESKSKHSSISKHRSSKHSKDKHDKKHSSSKIHISNSQKEERKRKLKDIATKEKEETKHASKYSSTTKEKAFVNVKVTSNNRGAFLTDVVQPAKRKESLQKASNKEKEPSNSLIETDVINNKKQTTQECSSSKAKDTETTESKKKHSDRHKSSKKDDEEKKKQSDKHKSSKSNNKSKDQDKKEPKLSKHKDEASKDESSKNQSTRSKSRKSSTSKQGIEDTADKIHRSVVPLKSVKPLTESEEALSGKPFSKVEPLPKPKKSVRFSDSPPQIRVFEIEEGNNMKKTSLIKTVDIQQTPLFSLEKLFLMKILRWNPHWLEEQINNNDPPPILGKNVPMTMFHSFNSHSQYVELVGDLLLLEIWECLTRGYMNVRHQNELSLRIGFLPPVRNKESKCFELFSMSVNVSVPNTDIRTVPRLGEVLLVTFGQENAKIKRFFYVHNVRTLPSPPNNIHSFFELSLHTCYTDKIKLLKLGERMTALRLHFLQSELSLYEAMEYLAGSPLAEAILKPEPKHFIKCEPSNFKPSEWTKFLNPSQQVAVHSSVTAALGDRPCIEMVQGPPGTGKSSVICAIVMSYFFDENSKKQSNRGKILICATSNAAVDELVIRLLNIRQTLPKTSRFRMVRVGRAEAMHPRARDISSQTLAQRDATYRHNIEPAHPAISEEIAHLEAKVNMWRTQEQDAKDPTRAAYCRSRVKAHLDKIALVRASGGGGARGDSELRADQLAASERRIIELADIVVTTLGSTLSHKIRVLRGRISLCIIDEAGQAIEPETLIPLTLDVTRLVLIGDPQQLPGFICSQRAKKHGLGESLFYRLTSCAESWPEGSPVILLNQQYRMQAAIADYPNRAFYAGKIISVPPVRPSLDIPPYSIVCIASGDKGQVSSGANEMESWGVARLVLALQSVLRQQNLSLAVISPYNAHKELIKRNIKLLQDPSEATTTVEVNTVDSFQGQERDVIVVSLARSSGLGFLSDAGRMNVMLTRARHALLLCLNPDAVTKNFQWRTLVEDAERRKLYRYLPIRICQGTSAGPIPHSEVLKYITCQQPKI